MTPWCDDLVCSWRGLLADRHSLPFPWTLSLHRRWCPSASHHHLTFLFLPALTFPLPLPFPSLGLSLRRPQCPSTSPHSFHSHPPAGGAGGAGRKRSGDMPILPGVRTCSGFGADLVDIVCAQTVGKRILVRETRTVVPLLTSTAPAPCGVHSTASLGGGGGLFKKFPFRSFCLSNAFGRR